MPEGPEIHRVADDLAEAMAGQVAQEIFFQFDHLKPFEEILTGQVVTAVEARGKAILTCFSNNLTIYSHNQLYGQWVIRQAYQYPQTNRQLRVAIHNQRKSALLYSSTEIEVLSDEELATHPFLSKLGPDPLDAAVTVEQVINRFLHKQFYRRRLHSLLLDQEFLAGLGNYLRSEILFVGRIHPTWRPMDCSGEKVRQLAEVVVKLTEQSYYHRGITNNLQLADKLRQQGLDRSQYRFWVFKREGKPCYVCGTLIVKEAYGGRRLFYCPVCQPDPID